MQKEEKYLQMARKSYNEDSESHEDLLEQLSEHSIESISHLIKEIETTVHSKVGEFLDKVEKKHDKETRDEVLRKLKDHFEDLADHKNAHLNIIVLDHVLKHS